MKLIKRLFGRKHDAQYSNTYVGRKMTVENNFAFRKERLSLVFKIIYVFAGLLGGSVIALAKNTALFFVLCPVITILIVVLIDLLAYSFTELRCLNIDNLRKAKYTEKADKKYDSIWFNVITCLITVMILYLIEYLIFFVSAISTEINKSLVTYMFCNMLIWFISTTVSYIFMFFYNKVCQAISTVFFTISINALMIIVAFSMGIFKAVTANA